MPKLTPKVRQAFAILTELAEHSTPVRWVDSAEVDDYHRQLEQLTAELGDDLSAFTVPSEALRPVRRSGGVPRSSMSGEPIGPVPPEAYSPKNYVHPPDLFSKRVTAAVRYLGQRLQALEIEDQRTASWFESIRLTQQQTTLLSQLVEATRQAPQQTLEFESPIDLWEGQELSLSPFPIP